MNKFSIVTIILCLKIKTWWNFKVEIVRGWQNQICGNLCVAKWDKIVQTENIIASIQFSIVHLFVGEYFN